MVLMAAMKMMNEKPHEIQMNTVTVSVKQHGRQEYIIQTFVHVDHTYKHN